MHDPVFLETADRIGSRLCRDALWSGNQCNWLGWALEVVGVSWSSVHRAQNASIYDGTAGIALFLARLYGFTQDRLHKEAAIGALNQAIARAEGVPEPMRHSVYSGTAGIAWAAIEVGRTLDDDRMVRRGLKDLKTSVGGPPHAAALDIIGGSAGTIQLLLDIAHRFDRPDFVDLAEIHGKFLLHTAVRSEAGWSWDTLPGQSEKHLCGYGHGASGIGCALLELWAHTNDAEYRRAGLKAFEYERSLFSPQDHNWPDLRTMTGFAPAGKPVFAMAWCHGGPGIGLARLRSVELTEDAETLTDLNEAMQITAASCTNVVFPASGSLCLCHGIGGNADLLLAASDMYGRRDLRQIAESVGHQAISQIQAPNLPWPCGVTTGGETPNLMLGLAGIGHFFLRLYDSEKIPSILLLRPQHARKPKAKAESAGVHASVQREHV